MCVPIAEERLARWSHHEPGTAFKQAHVPIRKALEAHKGLSRFKYEVFLQGSYKNDTNLGGDSDVDVVVRLTAKLKPSVADLSGKRL
jgi:tRNA nucleotidyltransferase (CCA-adding enzyme)